MRALAILVGFLLLAPLVPASDVVDLPRVSPPRESRALQLLDAALSPDPIVRARAAFPTLARDHAEGAAYLFPQRAGDLDGDGAADVLVERVDPVTGALLRVDALSGPTGAPLWTASPGAGGAHLALADGDVLRLVVEVDGVQPYTCDVVCAYAGVGDLTWTFALLDGATGAPRWERVVEGEMRTLATPDVTVQRERAALVMLSTCGADALCLVVIDVESRYARAGTFGAVGADAEHADHRIVTTASLLSLADGATLRALPAPGEDRLAFVEGAGDLDGDAKPELLWTSYGLPEGTRHCVEGEVGACDRDGVDTRLELHDGASLARRWTVERRAPGFDIAYASSPGMDFDGDGTLDLLLHEVVPDDETLMAFLTSPLSGATGEVAWSARDHFVFPLGDVGGEPGDDLLQVRYVADGFIVERLDGASGAVLGEPRAHLDVGWTVLGTAPDRNADGVSEVLVGVVPACDCARATTFDVRSGRTDALLFTLTLPGVWSGVPTGFGTSDLALTRIGGTEVGLARQTATGPVVAWTRALAPEDLVWVVLRAFGDLDGDGADDVVAHALYETPEGDERERLLAIGADGDVLWDPDHALANA